MIFFLFVFQSVNYIRRPVSSRLIKKNIYIIVCVTLIKALLPLFPSLSDRLLQVELLAYALRS